jgi:hypothetical protein
MTNQLEIPSLEYADVEKDIEIIQHTSRTTLHQQLLKDPLAAYKNTMNQLPIT